MSGSPRKSPEDSESDHATDSDLINTNRGYELFELAIGDPPTEGYETAEAAVAARYCTKLRMKELSDSPEGEALRELFDIMSPASAVWANLGESFDKKAWGAAFAKALRPQGETCLVHCRVPGEGGHQYVHQITPSTTVGQLKQMLLQPIGPVNPAKPRELGFPIDPEKVKSGDRVWIAPRPRSGRDQTMELDEMFLRVGALGMLMDDNELLMARGVGTEPSKMLIDILEI